MNLQYMLPNYDRDSIFPEKKSQYGHLPPTSWLRGMLSASGNTEAAANFSDQELALQNFQRRSPVPAVLMTRVSKDTSNDSMTQIEVEGGKQEMASDVGLFCANLLRMVSIGQGSLQAAVQDEKL